MKILFFLEQSGAIGIQSVRNIQLGNHDITSQNAEQGLYTYP